MLDILFYISLFDKADWDSVCIVFEKISLKSVDSGHYNIIDVLYKFYELNKRIDLENFYKTAWHNYLSV